MRDRGLTSFTILVTAVTLIVLAPTRLTTSAQTTTVSEKSASALSAKPGALGRTAWGDPDLGGVVWNYGTMTALERPAQFAGKDVLTEEEAAAFEQQSAARRATANSTAGPDWWDPAASVLKNRRTSLVVDPPDGKIPPLTPDAQKRGAARAAERRTRGAGDGPEDLGLKERCLSWESAGPPMLPASYNSNVTFIQTPGYIVIFNEMIHDARIVPMDGRPHGRIRRWMGDSRGHWEGATLVVDTINFGGNVNFRGSSENLHLTERFTRTAGPTLDYRFTVDDPTTWTKSWTVAIPMTTSEGRMYEYACHEGNFKSVTGTLNSARFMERLENK